MDSEPSEHGQVRTDMEMLPGAYSHFRFAGGAMGIVLRMLEKRHPQPGFEQSMDRLRRFHATVAERRRRADEARVVTIQDVLDWDGHCRESLSGNEILRRTDLVRDILSSDEQRDESLAVSPVRTYAHTILSNTVTAISEAAPIFRDGPIPDGFIGIVASVTNQMASELDAQTEVPEQGIEARLHLSQAVDLLADTFDFVSAEQPRF